jgi:hypothetical protein
MSKFDALFKTLSEAVPVNTTTAQPTPGGQPVANQPTTPGQPAAAQPAPAQPVVKPTVNPANIKSMDDLVKSFNDPSAKIDTVTLQTTLQNLAKNTQPKV